MSWLYLPKGIENEDVQILRTDIPTCMNCRCSQGQVGDYSEAGCSAGEQSVTSKSMTTASGCSNSGSQMGYSMTPRSGMTYEPSTGIRGLDLWISSLRDSRASHLAAQAGVLGQMTNETDGLPRSASFARYDPATCCWRTYQVCAALFGESHRTLALFSATWPRAGMTRDGIVFQLRPLARITRGTASGLLLPTPRAADARGSTYQYDRGDHSKPRLTLAGLVQRWPTPTARDWRSGKRLDSSAAFAQLSDRVGGTLNPPWIEWLMGWPTGWSALSPLAMARYQAWLQQFGGC